jgi:AcrR family transcriptional regulator
VRGQAIPSGGEGGAGSGRRRSAESHAAILAAAREILDEVGYFRLTIEGVAARARVGKTTVYRWWSSKSALVLEAVADQQPAPAALTGDLRADLRTVMDATVGMLRSDLAPTLMALTADLMHDGDDEMHATHLFHTDGEAIGAVLDRAGSSGALPAGTDSRLVQDIYIGTLLFRVLSNRSTDDVIETLLNLLLGTPERPPPA